MGRISKDEAEKRLDIEQLQNIDALINDEGKSYVVEISGLYFTIRPNIENSKYMIYSRAIDTLNDYGYEFSVDVVKVLGYHLPSLIIGR